MEIIKTKQLSAEQFQQINTLWNQEYPIQLKDRFGLLLEGVARYNHYLIQQNNRVMAWAVDFEKDQETRFSIIVDHNQQGKGLGTLLLNRLKKDIGECYGWVIDHNNDLKENGENYKSPLAFYTKNGFEVLLDQRIDNEMLNAVKIKHKVAVFCETARCILREILPTDVDGLFELDANPEVHRYLGNSPVSSKQQIVEVIDFIRQQYSDNGIGRWAVVDKKTNEFMGWAGLKFERNLTHGHINYYDLGYRLIERFWGQGIATEVAAASLAYAFDHIGTKVVYAMVDAENRASNAVLKKVGMRYIDTFELDAVPHNWYEINYDDYTNNLRQQELNKERQHA